MAFPQETHPDIFGPPETETPIEVVKSWQEPPKPAAQTPIAAPADATAIAVVESISKVQAAIAEFNRIAATVPTLLIEHPQDIACAVSTPAGMKQAIAGRAAWRAPRVALEHARKAAKAPVLTLGRAIDAFATNLEAKLLAGESHYDDQVKAEERRIAAEREAKREAEERRVAAHQSRIDMIKNALVEAAGASVASIDEIIVGLVAFKIGPECQEFEAVTRNAQAETLAKLRSMREQQDQRDAEAAELARLRAEEEARKAHEAAALAESRRVEGERLKAEAQALADARAAQEAEFASRRAEQEAIEAAAAKERAQLLHEANEAAAAARVMRGVEEAQARKAAEARREQEEAESAERRRAEIAAQAEQQRQETEKHRQGLLLLAHAGDLLEALLAVRDWDVEANALPAVLAIQVQKAIERASPTNAAADGAAYPKPSAKPRPKSRIAELRDEAWAKRQDSKPQP